MSLQSQTTLTDLASTFIGVEFEIGLRFVMHELNANIVLHLIMDSDSLLVVDRHKASLLVVAHFHTRVRVVVPTEIKGVFGTRYAHHRQSTKFTLVVSSFIERLLTELTRLRLLHVPRMRLHHNGFDLLNDLNRELLDGALLTVLRDGLHLFVQDILLNVQGMTLGRQVLHRIFKSLLLIPGEVVVCFVKSLGGLLLRELGAIVGEVDVILATLGHNRSLNFLDRVLANPESIDAVDNSVHELANKHAEVVDDVEDHERVDGGANLVACLDIAVGVVVRELQHHVGDHDKNALINDLKRHVPLLNNWLEPPQVDQVTSEKCEAQLELLAWE